MLLLLGGSLLACGDNKEGTGDDGDDTPQNPYPKHKCGDADITSAHCVQVPAADSQALLEATNALEADTTIVLAVGTFAMSNEVNIQNTAKVHILGQGIDSTVLDWAGTTAQVNGIVAAQSDGFLVEDFTVQNSIKDGIRVEASDGVTYRRIKATWAKALEPTNGAYGIYPVRSKHVLVEDSVAINAADAGLYVGQCQQVIVRGNEVHNNVAGLEIENTEYADVHDNNVHDNTGGLVVFDLPGNPIVGHDISIHDNMVHDNNSANFAAGGTVAAIPVGTGTFAMASRRVEIKNNAYKNNNTVDIAIVSGLIIEQDMSKWTIDSTTVQGDITGLALLPSFMMDGTPVNDATKFSNFRSENIVIAGNTHSGSGTAPDLFDPNMLGQLLKLRYSAIMKPVD
ncbi:MAG TPA: parallel beta-helix domain-containing protein, partial [Kofleriaceae bacterium]